MGVIIENVMIMGIFNYFRQRIEYFASLVKRKDPDKDIFVNQKVLERYGDFEEIGQWGVFNTETGESEIKGKMVSETVKYKDSDGTIKLGKDWVAQDSLT